MKYIPTESNCTIKLPVAWVKELKLESGAMLEKTVDGILIRPYTTHTWDEIYAKKLKIGNPSLMDISEVSGDDLIF